MLCWSGCWSKTQYLHTYYDFFLDFQERPHLALPPVRIEDRKAGERKEKIRSFISLKVLVER